MKDMCADTVPNYTGMSKKVLHVETLTFMCSNLMLWAEFELQRWFFHPLSDEDGLIRFKVKDAEGIYFPLSALVETIKQNALKRHQQ